VDAKKEGTLKNFCGIVFVLTGKDQGSDLMSIENYDADKKTVTIRLFQVKVGNTSIREGNTPAKGGYATNSFNLVDIQKKLFVQARANEMWMSEMNLFPQYWVLEKHKKMDMTEEELHEDTDFQK